MADRSSARTRPADALTLEVLELVGTVVARYHEEYELAAAEHSLTGSQARVLALISREPTPMRKLAQRLKCEPSNVTGMVDRLEQRGLVERRADPADRRVKVAAATDEGRTTASRLRSALDFAGEPLAELTPLERTLLRDLLKRMLGQAPEEEGTPQGVGTGAGTGTGPGAAQPAKAD
ncbi:MarR family winged helix-turn-helix transcriptional regulator [Streptomyces sp. NPDC048172]|uniref:MarR family winged helix-turn-helix transcriptional regulator n=1 Tax=Streptomyces sp. NPDC048172 TaxID=3365505 RepID=UPI003719C2CC